MRSRLFHVTVAGVSLVALTASWLGCGGSSASSPATLDSGVAAVEAGSTPDAAADAADAAPATTDASTKPDAALSGPLVDLQYGNCTGFSACGGDPIGTWKITGGCVDDTVFDSATSQCPGLTSSTVVFQARGTIVADATTITRTTEVKLTATFAVPQVCKESNPLGTKCPDLETALKVGAGLDTATCKDAAAGGGCDCDVGQTTNEATADAYTTSGNTLTSAARTFDYCVAESELKFKETTAKAPLPGFLTLTK
jgi:hypothetical protein